MGYAHIDNLYKNQTILKTFKRCYALEKIHGCVKKGTLVTLADGSIRPIEDVVAGTLVVSYDEQSGDFVTATVEALVVQEPNPVLPWMRVTLADGRTLECTADHPFMTTTGWVRADALTPEHDVLTV